MHPMPRGKHRVLLGGVEKGICRQFWCGKGRWACAAADVGRPPFAMAKVNISGGAGGVPCAEGRMLRQAKSEKAVSRPCGAEKKPYLTVTLTVLLYEPHLTVIFAVPAFTPFMVMTLTSVPVTFTTEEFELVPVTTAVA